MVFPRQGFTPLEAFGKGISFPPLFFSFVQRLLSLLWDTETNKLVHGVKVARNVPSISHLFCTNDSLLFTCACDEEAETILDIPSYEIASG